jgi:thymidine phosphorylase
VSTSLEDGSALAAYERWILAQGGDPDPASLPRAPVVREVPAPAAGFVRELRARQIAAVAMALGAGRERKEDPIDLAVGVVCLAKHGDRIEPGEPLAEIHARDDVAAEAAKTALLSAYEIGDEPQPRPLVLEVIR